MPDLALPALKADAQGGGDLAAGAADAQFDVARFHDAPAVASGERGQIGVDLEARASALTRLQRDPCEADQPDHGPRRLGHRIVEVELDHLGPGHAAGVLDIDLDRLLYNLDAVNPGVRRLLVSARTGDGVEEFRDWLLALTGDRERAMA